MANPMAKNFECHVNPASAVQMDGSRCVKMNLAGTLVKMDSADHLYVLHNTSGDYVWNLYDNTEDCLGPKDISEAWSSGYMNKQDIIENNVNYSPIKKKYLGHIKFEVPLGYGKFEFILPPVAMDSGEFTAFMISSWVSDHDGTTVTLDCKSFAFSNPLSDHFLNYTDVSFLGDEALTVRNAFRTAETSFTRTALAHKEETNWNCTTYELNVSDGYSVEKSVSVTKNIPLKLQKNPKSAHFVYYTASGLIEDQLFTSTGNGIIPSNTSDLKSIPVTIRRSKTKNKKYDLYIEFMSKSKTDNLENAQGLYSIINPKQRVKSYAFCSLASRK